MIAHNEDGPPELDAHCRWPQTNDNLEVQAGKVIFHSKDRDEVYREAIKHHLKHFALLYTGTMAKDMAIVL